MPKLEYYPAGMALLGDGVKIQLGTVFIEDNAYNVHDLLGGIVRACNAHDELVAALERATELIEDTPCVWARAALEAAKG